MHSTVFGADVYLYPLVNSLNFGLFLKQALSELLSIVIWSSIIFLLFIIYAPYCPYSYNTLRHRLLRLWQHVYPKTDHMDFEYLSDAVAHLQTCLTEVLIFVQVFSYPRHFLAKLYQFHTMVQQIIHHKHRSDDFIILGTVRISVVPK